VSVSHDIDWSVLFPQKLHASCPITAGASRDRQLSAAAAAAGIIGYQIDPHEPHPHDPDPQPDPHEPACSNQ